VDVRPLVFLSSNHRPQNERIIGFRVATEFYRPREASDLSRRQQRIDISPAYPGTRFCWPYRTYSVISQPRCSCRYCRFFLTQTLKASGSVIGLVEGIAGATQNIAQGLSGSLSDKLQRRKSIVLVGYFLAAIGKPLMGIAATWQGVLSGRFVDRFGAGTRSAPRDALIASSVDEANRGRAFGLEGTGDNAGAFLGPLLAVLLLVVYHLQIRWIFYLAVIPGPLAFLMVLFVRERPLKTAAKTKDIGASMTATILIYSGFNWWLH
jgi:MFS family permease